MTVNKTNNPLSPHIIEHKKITQPPPLDNWISMTIQIIKENLHRFATTQKKADTITKMNDNINMDTMIAGAL